jgi:hypothetical protein
MRVDAHGNIESVSDGPAHLFGFKPQALQGRNLSEVCSVCYKFFAVLDIFPFVYSQLFCCAKALRALEVAAQHCLSCFGLGTASLQVLDVFEGLPCSGDAQGLDMEHVMTELVHA